MAVTEITVYQYYIPPSGFYESPTGEPYIMGGPSVPVAGGGDVYKVGIPANTELGIWTGDGTIKGDPSITWNGIALDISGNIIANLLSLENLHVSNDASIVNNLYVGGTLFAVDACIDNQTNYDTSTWNWHVWNDASIDRNITVGNDVSIIGNLFVDGNNILTYINQLDASAIRIDLYNLIQDTSAYVELNQIEASIVRIDASLGLGGIGVTADYVDGSISVAVDAVDTSLV
ncbi:unnamed protein product, partial [marine sediment metagenome]